MAIDFIALGRGLRKLAGDDRPVAAVVVAPTDDGYYAGSSRPLDKVKDGVTTDELWALPGGHLEDGETPAQAALREAAEEGWDLEGFDADKPLRKSMVSWGGKPPQGIWWYGAQKATMRPQYKEQHRLRPVRLRKRDITTRTTYGDHLALAELLRRLKMAQIAQEQGELKKVAGFRLPSKYIDALHGLEPKLNPVGRVLELPRFAFRFSNNANPFGHRRSPAPQLEVLDGAGGVHASAFIDELVKRYSGTLRDGNGGVGFLHRFLLRRPDAQLWSPEFGAAAGKGKPIAGLQANGGAWRGNVFETLVNPSNAKHVETLPWELLKTAGFRDAAERERLPYRTTAEALLLDENGHIVSRRGPSGYLSFPGGGVDPGEDPRDGLLREIREETGLDVDDLKLHQRVKWDWPQAWPKSAKQKQRYTQFRGEDSHIFTGRVKGRGAQTSTEGDHWGKVPSVPIADIEKEYAIDQGDFAPYKSAQLAALRALGAKLQR